MAGRRRGDLPGILTLLEFIEEHRGAVEFDWRVRFQARLDVPGEFGYGEAWRLLQRLLADPTSHVAAEVAGWDYPLTREAQILADLYDLTHKVAAGRRKTVPYPRPWDKRRKKFGKASRSQAQIRAALAARAPRKPSGEESSP